MSADGRTLRVVNHIRRLRFDRSEMTQQALADACGVTRQTIIALEAGRYTPSLELAFRIADAFGARIEDVFQWINTNEQCSKANDSNA
jgi:putative transcriptional regulator